MHLAHPYLAKFTQPQGPSVHSSSGWPELTWLPLVSSRDQLLILVVGSLTHEKLSCIQNCISPKFLNLEALAWPFLSCPPGPSLTPPISLSPVASQPSAHRTAAFHRGRIKALLSDCPRVCHLISAQAGISEQVALIRSHQHHGLLTKGCMSCSNLTKSTPGQKSRR